MQFTALCSNCIFLKYHYRYLFIFIVYGIILICNEPRHVLERHAQRGNEDEDTYMFGNLGQRQPLLSVTGSAPGQHSFFWENPLLGTTLSFFPDIQLVSCSDLSDRLKYKRHHSLISVLKFEKSLTGAVMKCFLCQQNLHDRGDFVSLMCPCLILICQNCALNACNIRNGFIMDSLVCPFCGSSTSTEPIIDKHKGDVYTWSLVDDAYRNFGMITPNKDRLSESSYEMMKQKFLQKGVQLSQAIEHENHLTMRIRSIATMEAARQRQRHLEITIPRIFKSNSCIENLTRSIANNDRDFKVNCVCSVDGFHRIPKHNSVLITCQCNKSMCRRCAYEHISSSFHTFNLASISCPHCKGYSKVLGNIEGALECENQLLSAAQRRFNKTPQAVLTLKAAQTLYAHFQAIHGTGIWYRQPEDNLNLTTLRLEVARLEATHQRIDNGELVPRTNECTELLLGPLALLKFRNDKFLEMFLKNATIRTKLDEPTNPYFEYNVEASMEVYVDENNQASTRSIRKMYKSHKLNLNVTNENH